MTQTAPQDRAGATPPPRVAVVGMHGYGAQHVRHAVELAGRGRLVFVAAADRVPAAADQLPDGVREFTDAAEMLAEVGADVVTIATPIHTHLPIAELALRAGADVLLEKPPVTSLSQFEELGRAAAETGRVVQVGFQSLGSHAIGELRRMMAAGELGEITGISGVGRWLRTLDYWRRSPWAGRRQLDGVEVVDGVVTNPLAHATATALRLAGADTLEGPAELEVELFRANSIEADDTSVVRIVTATGLPVTVALTLCAGEQETPFVEVTGTAGSARFFYTDDVVELRRAGDDVAQRVVFDRTSLLDNLIEHRATGATLLSPLTSSGGFTRVLDAVRRGRPRQIPSSFSELREDEHGRHVVIGGIEDWVERAAFEHRTFSALDAPFAR